MNDNTFINKRKPSVAVLAVAVASIMMSAPTLADQASEDQLRRDNATVTVDEAAPQVAIDQPAPRVTAEQTPTDVDVETGEPRVTVDQPEPEVSIEQPEPEVSVEQAEPQIDVNSAEPQVTVNEAEPEIEVKRAEPEIRVVNKDAEGNLKEGLDAESAQSLVQVQLSDLEGREVVTASGESLGDVKDIVAGPQGSQPGFVVSLGGFLGLGSTDILVPAHEAELGDDTIVWQTQQSRDQLKRTHEYQAEQFESISGRYDTLGEAQRAEMTGRSPE